MSDEPKRMVRFNPEINLGHVLTAALMLASGLAVFINLNMRLTVLEVRVPTLEKSLEAIAITQKAAVENQIAQTRALDRITVLVEERNRKP